MGPERPVRQSTFEGVIDATRLWTGEPERDAHLRSADFFDVDSHPWINFRGRIVERTGDIHFKALTELTIRGVTRELPLDVSFLGEWETPYWVGDENRGTMRRIGFEATTALNRHDFGVSGRTSSQAAGWWSATRSRLLSTSRRSTTRISSGWVRQMPSGTPTSSRLRRAPAARMACS